MAHAGESPNYAQEHEPDIIPRDIRFNIAANKKRHWFGDDIAKTALIDGLSIFLPEGERFFIRSLKHYGPQLKELPLGAEINGYAVQEAFHTREHEEYNCAMIALGYPVDDMEKSIKAVLGSVNKPLYRLAVTCAIEHLTATLSTVTLRHPEMMADAAPAYRRLWMWHALEEIEHKAVALDVLKAVTPNTSAWQRYLLRVMAMNGTLIPFLGIFLKNVATYARTDGVKPGLRFWMRFLWVVFVSPGFWRRSLPLLLSYYLPNFNPRNSDDARLVRSGRDWLDREMPDYAQPAGGAAG